MNPGPSALWLTQRPWKLRNISTRFCLTTMTAYSLRFPNRHCPHTRRCRDVTQAAPPLGGAHVYLWKSTRGLQTSSRRVGFNELPSCLRTNQRNWLENLALRIDKSWHMLPRSRTESLSTLDLRDCYHSVINNSSPHSANNTRETWCRSQIIQ